MTGEPKYPIEQSDLVALTTWRGHLLMMADTAERAQLRLLLAALKEPIDIVDRLIRNGLDPQSGGPLP